MPARFASIDARRAVLGGRADAQTPAQSPADKVAHKKIDEAVNRLVRHRLAFVDDERVRIFAHAGGLDDQSGSVARSQVRRSEHDIGALLARERADRSAASRTAPWS